MKNLLNRGKAVVSCISVLSILAVSLLSMFTGVTFIASADDAVVSSPSNGTYDADVVISEDGIYYSEIDTAVKTEVSKFTGFETDFLKNAKGRGTANDPYIIENANQFAAVATGYLLEDSNDEKSIIDTEGMTFKVADNVKAFDMNNTDSTVDFSGNMTAKEVEDAFSDVNTDLVWKQKAVFKGRFNGNGVVVYGLYVNNETNASIFPEAQGNTIIRNITVKNSYFRGEAAAVFVARNTTSNSIITTFQNCSAYNNVVISKRLNNSIDYGGILAAANSKDNTLVVEDCLVYGNVARHDTYDITYGLYGRFHGLKSATVTNSIIMDCVPHTQYYGSNAFHNSTYTNVYTNKIGEKYTNTDYQNRVKNSDDNTTTVGDKYIYTYNYAVDTTGSISATFDFSVNDVSKGVNYNRTFSSGTMVKVETSDIIGATELQGLDASRWTYNKDGYPTPKIYNAREYSAGDAWTGEVAVFFSGGDGTKSSPYEITTAEELARMLLTATDGKYYILKADIIINDTSAENWTKNAKQWFTSNDVNTFACSLDGNGHTVSGLYYTGKQAGAYAGLIPVLGSGATIKNLKVENSVLNGDMVLGAVAGAVADSASKVININAVTVEDTVVYDDDASATGIIGTVGYSALKMNDCISKSGGLFSGVTGQARVKRCISVGAYPFGNTEYITADSVYTNTKGADLKGVTVLADDEMKGAAAKTNMEGLGIPYSWSVVNKDYPTPTGNEDSSEGIVGEVWSGAVASKYASGAGTESDPYIIETAEQLALCVYDGEIGTGLGKNVYYKLAADIYLNDVNGNLWKDKIGCNEWYTQRTTKTYSKTKYITFDGDGYVVYGLYINHTDGSDYVRAGLFPQVGEGTIVKNLGMSNVYLIGETSKENPSDSLGAIWGTTANWASDAGLKLDAHDAEGNKSIINTEDYQLREPKIINCFVDHNSVISGYYTGGFVGSINSSVYMENCIFTGSIYGQSDTYYSGTLVGMDNSYGTTLIDCLSLPQNAGLPMGGSSASSWRTSTSNWVINAVDTYYFASSAVVSYAAIKLNKPSERIGETARAAMTGLDWVDKYDPDAEDQTTWIVIDEGTPLPSIFAKHRNADQLAELSDRAFNAPEVTVSFITGTSEVTVDDISGKMYSKISLPLVERQGYKFTGWYVFPDYSIEYPNDYFPPRDLVLYAGWEPMGVVQTFENYPDTIWDYDDTQWILNKPGAKGGYKNAYVRNGSKSMHLYDTNTESADVLLNYADMLVPGSAYTMTFWVTTDKESNPATLVSLVHNSYPDYLDTATAIEDMAVVTGLKVGEWVQYSYSFTAKTQWVSLRATGGASLYFDDIIMASIDGTLSDGKVINLGTGDASLSPNTNNSVSVAVLISVIMACATVVVVSRKNLVEVIEE